MTAHDLPSSARQGDIVYIAASNQLAEVIDVCGGTELHPIHYDAARDMHLPSIGHAITTSSIASSAITAAKIVGLDSTGVLGVSDLSNYPELSVMNDCVTEGTFDDVLTILANDTTGKAAEIVREAMMHETGEVAKTVDERVQASLAGLKAAGFTIDKAKVAEEKAKEQAAAERQRSYDVDDKAGMF